MAIEFQQRDKCPICESYPCRPIYRLPFSNKLMRQFLSEFYQERIDYTLLQNRVWSIHQCNQCRFIFQSDVLNVEGQVALYGEWVDSFKSLRKKQNAKTKLFRQYAAQLETIGRLLTKTPAQIDILEFGMGWGYWSRMANAFGFHVVGFELSADRVDHARGLGIEVIDSLPESGPHYDFVYANQVFEHLEEPLQTLQQLVARLKPGGIIYIRVPDGRSIRSNLARHGWTPQLDAVHPLEHINCFTRKTLCRMALKAGLKVVQPPVRIDMSRFKSALKREIYDRYLGTHIFFGLK